MILKNKLVFLILTLAACASVPSRPDHLSVGHFDQVGVGVDAKTAVRLLGEPTEIRTDFKDNPNAVWIYDDKSEFQRGSISVTPEKQIVAAVIVIPQESEPESRLKFLLENKFASSHFERAPTQRCGRHYVPHQVFYIDVEKGIVIVAHRLTDEVESFTRADSQLASDLLKRIRDCKL